MPRKMHPRAYLPYKLRPSSFRTGAPLRPRDLAARPKAPRQPTLPAELFTAALLDADALGLECLRHQAPLHNIAVRIHAEEIRGAVEGIFQDPSTFRLHLTLRPVMYMRPLKVVLAEFVGDECQYSAPTWLSRLWRAESKSAERVRSYEWVIKYVYNLLATPGLVLPAQQAWEEVLRYVEHIKRVCEFRPRVRDPARPPPRPRPRYKPAKELVTATESLGITASVEAVQEAPSQDTEVAMEGVQAGTGMEVEVSTVVSQDTEDSDAPVIQLEGRLADLVI